MKRFIWLLIFSRTLVAASQSLNVEQAVKQGYLKQIKKNKPGTHYSKALQFEFLNNKSSEVAIHIEPGWLFQPNDSGLQRMICVDDQYITLAPGKLIMVVVEGMCTQASHGGAGDQTVYSVAGLAKKEWVEWARFIQKKKLFDIDGQQGMWCLSDTSTHSPWDIMVDSPLVKTYRPLLFSLRHLNPNSKPLPTKSWEKVIEDTIWYEGYLDYNYATTKNVHIAIFNTRGIVVKELYHNPNEPAGKHHQKYAFGLGSFPDPEYLIMLAVDGEVKIKSKIDLRPFRD